MEKSIISDYVDLPKLISECEKLLFEKDWEAYSDSDGIKAEVKSVSGSDIKMIRYDYVATDLSAITEFLISFRARVTLNAPIDNVAEFCWNMREETLKRADSAMGKVIDNLSKYNFLLLTSFHEKIILIV
jgi:hypothetical protein